MKPKTQLLLRADFWRLLAFMKEHEIAFTILGNPFHLNDEVCGKLKEYGCEKYQLSVDGLRKTHDWFRKSGSFDITLSKIGCINRAGIRSVVMTTVSGTNIDEIPEIIDAVVAAGANVFAFARYCPTSREKDVGITAGLKNAQIVSSLLSAADAPPLQTENTEIFTAPIPSAGQAKR